MVHDSHGDHHRRKVIHIVGCGDAERSMDFEAKKDEGPEMTKGSYEVFLGQKTIRKSICKVDPSNDR